MPHIELKQASSIQHPASNSAFTFIELMITLMVVAICFVPIMRMFSTTLEEIAYIDDMRTGIDLAREEIEKVKNLSLSEKQIKMMGNVVSPPIYLNGAIWRTARTVERGTEPLQVTAYAFREDQWGRPAMTLVTLIKK